MLARRGPYGTSLPTRQAILLAIQASPWCTKSEVMRATGLGWGTVYHHVRQMKRQGVIRSSRAGRRELYCPADAPPSFRPIMRLLRDEMCSAILAEIRLAPGQGVQGLSKRLEVPRHVISRYLTPLVGEGLVERVGGFRGQFKPVTKPADLGGDLPFRTQDDAGALGTPEREHLEQ